MQRTGHRQPNARINSGLVLSVFASGLFVWVGGTCGGNVPAPLDPNAGQTVVAQTNPDVNTPPTFTFVQPDRDRVIERGQQFLIQWIDEDPDPGDNPVIQIELDRDGIPNSGNEIRLVADRLANDDGPGDDSIIVSTANLRIAEYIVRASIDDGTNSPILIQAPGSIRIVLPGTGPRNAPPVINLVTAPIIDLGLAQGDILTISWVDNDPDNPDPNDPRATDAEVLVMLDSDLDPTNDDPNNPIPGQLIVLPDNPPTDPNPRGQSADTEDLNGNGILDAGEDTNGNGLLDDIYTLTIDVSQIPQRANGAPYFIRIRIDDGINPPVDRYAPGTIRILSLASGIVDLGEVGKTIMGARWTGFNPGGQAGSLVRFASDADQDGTDDCMIVARFGNPRNLGNIGEAWLLYGIPGLRFGGLPNVNSIGTRIRGHVFEGRVPSAFTRPNQPGRTDGLTGFVAMPDIDGDGAPEMLFGLPHVDGTPNDRDDDPDDAPDDPGDTYFDAWPQILCTESPPDTTPPDDNIDSQGFVSLVSSTTLNATLAEAVNLFGQNVPGGRDIQLHDAGQVQQGGGFADIQVNGCRFQAAIFDFFLLNGFNEWDPIEAQWGRDVDVLPDINNDGVSELIISAPRNELDIERLRQLPALVPGFDGLFRSHPHLPVGVRFSEAGSGASVGLTGVGTRFYEGNVVVFLGQNFTAPIANWNIVTSFAIALPGGSITDQDGNQTFPFIMDGVGDCPPGTPIVGRHLATPFFFQVFGEKPSDELGNAHSAGDFNLDGSPDLVMGAPFADAGSLLDTGAAYIVYGRLPVGDTDLSDLDNPARPRPPTVRIFGDRPGDHFGTHQESVLDVNGDRIDDILITSGDIDGPLGIDSGMTALIFGGQRITGDFVVNQIATSELRGIRFYGSNAGDRAGVHASSAGDFNGDGFGDLLIVAPGEDRVVSGVIRKGVVYLVFGGRHLNHNRVVFLNQVGSPSEDQNDNGRLDAGEDANGNGILDLGLPGMVFVSPYQAGTLDEAAPLTASFVGDLDSDGFADIMIGNQFADFVDPASPGQRRPDAGAAYLVYGNNTGSNSLVAPRIIGLDR